MSLSPELELEQKTLRTRITYRFFSDYVEYTIRDGNGAMTSFKAQYAGLPPKFDYRVYQPPRRPAFVIQVFAVLCLCWVAVISFPWRGHEPVEFAALFGVLLVAGWAYLRVRSKTVYTSIPVRNGKVLVLQDKRHAEVIEALESRRVRFYRKLAVIDPRNPPAIELRKFTWLKEQGVISEEEFETFRQKLARDAISQLPPLKPPTETVQ